MVPVILGLFALAVMMVALVVMIGVLGFAAANILAIVLALIAGLGISALFGGGSGTLTALVALAVFYIMMRGKQQRVRRRRQGYDVELVAEPVKPAPAAAKPLPKQPETPLDLAWAAVAENADWARSRLAVAQESCRLFLGVADRLPSDVEAGGLAVRIRKRIPEHVHECLDKCEVATASERRAILDELVFTLEKVGASADRERTRLMGPVSAEMSVQRRHLTRDAEHGPIGLD